MSPAWDPVALRAAQSPLEASLYFCVAFFIAHMFLFPLFLGLAVWVFLREGGPWAAAVTLVSAVLYAATYFVGSERKGSRLWPAFCVPWVGCHPYFPVRVLMWDVAEGAWKSEPSAGHAVTYPVSTVPHIFAMFPHGPIPLSAAVFRPQIARWPWLSERLRLGAADAVFWLPIVRDLYLWWGTVTADKRTLLALLRRGLSVLLLPGGIREQLVVPKPHEDVVVLGDRKGFIRLALETGSRIVPVYCFGERRGFITQRATSTLSTLFKRLCNVGLPVVRGRWFTLMPFATPLTIAVGKPIDVPPGFRKQMGADDGSGSSSGAGSMPSSCALDFDAAVEALHAQFVASLRELYETHKHTSGYSDVELVIR